MAQQEMPKSLGRYEIVRELGKGAMGIVYEGVDPVIGRRVAIKTARRDVLESSGRAEELMERFLREAHAAGSMNHPGIITIYDADEENGVAYIAMEYIDYGNLQDYLKKRGHIDPEEAVEIAVSICNALHAAHDAGVVHRDIKPANIMVRPDGTIKIADFGIAHTDDSQLTQEGAMVGTPHYMSPEQFMGQKVDGRSDLFCVGVMLYEMLTNERPFDGEVLSTVMHKVIKVDPIDPKELNFSVPDALSKVVLKSLAKNPRNRYQTGRAMAAALAESLKEHPDPAILSLAPVEAPPGSATVVTRPPEPGTVVSGRPAGTPQPETAPPAGTTVSQRSQEAATVVSAAPPASASANTPPSAEMVATLAGVTPPTKKNLLIPGIGVLAVLAIIGIGALYLSDLGKPGDRSSAGNANGSSSNTSSSQDGNKGLISRLDITVYFADTKEARDLAMDRDYTACNQNAKATLTIFDPQAGPAPITQLHDFVADIVKLEKGYDHLKITASAPGYGEKSVEVTDEKPCSIVLTKSDL